MCPTPSFLRIWKARAPLEKCSQDNDIGSRKKEKTKKGYKNRAKTEKHIAIGYYWSTGLVSKWSICAWTTCNMQQTTDAVQKGL